MILRLVKWWLRRRGLVAVDVGHLAAVERELRQLRKAVTPLGCFGTERLTP